tara:strand:+ start:623 stop:838 length:216 start_codon:yes stop_codon:yes gene_type:complete
MAYKFIGYQAMTRRERLKQQAIKEIEAFKQNKCWVHDDQLIRGITEPSYGLPSGYDAEVQKRYPSPTYSLI